MRYDDRGLRLVADTNIFVAAAFNSNSSAARILSAVADGRWFLIWNEPTKAETRNVLTRIPPLSWTSFAPLFQPEYRFDGPTPDRQLQFIPDRADIKFAALAVAAGAILVSNDDHLLSHRLQLTVPVLRSMELILQTRWRDSEEGVHSPW